MSEDTDQSQETSLSRCVNHPERDAAGVCRACGRTICAECATKVQGINFCIQCLVLFDTNTGKTKKSKTGKLVQELAAALIFIIMVGMGMAAAYGIPALRASGISEDEQNDYQVKDIARSQTSLIYHALRSFYDDVGRYPTLDEGLAALWDEDPLDLGEEIFGWSGPYAVLENWDYYDLDEKVLYARGIEIHYGLYNEDDLCRYYLMSPGTDGEWDTPELDSLIPPYEGHGDDIIKWLSKISCEEL